MCDLVLVCGGERMQEVNNFEATEFVSYLSHRYAEYVYGVTLPALAGMFARLYMERYGVDARAPGDGGDQEPRQRRARTRKAHLRIPVTMEGILTGPDALNEQPLDRRAAALLRLLPGERRRLGRAAGAGGDGEGVPARRRCCIAGIGQATDTQAVHERPDPTELTAVRLAAEKAFAMAGARRPKDIHVAELHDAFTILEIAESEEAGFFTKGEGHKALERGETQIGGQAAHQPVGRAQGARAPRGQHRRVADRGAGAAAARRGGRLPGAERARSTASPSTSAASATTCVATVLKRGV